MSGRINNPEELARIRDRSRSEMDLRSGPKEMRITVHMGTCGIAAGARDVLAGLADELARGAVQNVTLRQSGCAGLCDQEPMLTFTDSRQNDFMYVRLDREKARQIVQSHVLKGEPVRSLLLTR
jgi:NADP-reducing hydrogenase subunit HndB